MMKIFGLINKWVGAFVTFVSFASILGIGSFCCGIWKSGLSVYIDKCPQEFAIGCVSFGVLCMGGLMWWFFSMVIKRNTANSVDYKVVCRKLPVDTAKELAKIDYAYPFVDEAQAEFCTSLDEQKFKNLLNSPDVDCENLKSGSKKGKTILQCSFIPVDADGNTIIIRRRAINHNSIFKKLRNWFKTINAFISFSPIPDGHNRLFDSIVRCYAHEVPNDGVKLTDSNFKCIGAIYNRRGGGKRPRSIFFWQKKNVRANLDECIRYLFLVYIVHYPNSHFAKDGQPNWTDIDLAFAAKHDRGSKRKDRFFLKDHDLIVGVDSVVDIASALASKDSDACLHWLKVEQEALRRVARKIADKVVA